MKKTLRTSLLCLSALLATPALAINQYILQAGGPSIDYELPINEPQLFTNIFMWIINVDCTIISKSSINTISVRALRKQGSVNDISLSPGDTMVVTVDAGEAMRLTAQPGARVELTNEGDEHITARCSAVTEIH